ncbi:hypothetical protein [Halosimplex sp. TS25]|uniref:hypothetical protein n=1 Tax=Halosimplex rarum TaxID=3396619 RepID=UPI0039E75F5A
MSFDALQRTVRRCTAVVVAILGIGFGEVASGFGGTPLVVAALIYLVASALFGVARLYNKRAGVVDVAPPGEGETEANDPPSS